MYKNIITAKLPAYLRGKRKKNDRALTAKFRCGNKIEDGQHWREINDNMCRICQKEKESFKHILSRCETTKGEQDLIRREFLDETGGGITLMKRIKEERGRSGTVTCTEAEKQGSPGRAKTTQPKRSATNQRPRVYKLGRVYKLEISYRIVFYISIFYIISLYSILCYFSSLYLVS